MKIIQLVVLDLLQVHDSRTFALNFCSQLQETNNVIHMNFFWISGFQSVRFSIPDLTTKSVSKDFLISLTSLDAQLTKALILPV